MEVSGLSAAVLNQLRTQAEEPAALQRWLAIYTEQTDWKANIGVPPLHGTYRVEPGVLRFEPQFPLEPGLSYRAVFRPVGMPGEKAPALGEVASVFKVPPRRLEASTR